MQIETIIMRRTPKLSGKAKQYSRGYVKLALVDVDREELDKLGQSEPKMISERSRGVVKIRRGASLYYGKGIKSEGAKYLKELEERKQELNTKKSES